MIKEELDENGKPKWRDKKGNAYKKTTLFSRIRNNWTLLQSTYGNLKRDKNSFETFCENFVVKHRIVTGRRVIKLSRKLLCETYYQFCKNNNLLETSESFISRYVDKTYKCAKHYVNHGAIVYHGLSLCMNNRTLK